ncbi:hypothetical protein ACQP2Y_46685 (plasmid) [Actinoplanes sp. CA-051413]|uniref:hypothetical protein n=1 Tax=Actinoplanes sp. CA-051413 TaxID=3239899 RepID=UPI003D992A4C
MSTATGEVLGLTQSIAYAQHLAEQARLHGPDGNQSYLARLAACRVTGDGLTTGHSMQNAFAAAAIAAAAHATELGKQTSIQEQYDVNPDAGDKTYLTGADGTDPAVAAATDEPAERSERDVLARGAYIGPGPLRWQRDRAREWDAGRVDADQRAAAYAHADQVLADRAQVAAGPGADRQETMRENGVLRCPPWCPQDDDEHDHEAHIGPGSTFTTADGDTVTVRPRVSWWSDIEPAVEMTVTPGEHSDGTLVLTAAELGRLQQLSSEVLAEAQQQHGDDALASGKPAYPGAYSEAVDAAHDVDDPAAAAAAIDLQDRASGYDLTADTHDDGDGPYLDWSSRTEAGVRHLEVSDGEDAIGLSLTTPELQQLRDDIGRLVGAVNDGEPDPGIMYSDDDGAYIDWSTTEDGVRYVEFGDGDDAVQLELTDAQLRELHQRLALQLQLDAQDSDR